MLGVLSGPILWWWQFWMCSEKKRPFWVAHHPDTVEGMDSAFRPCRLNVLRCNPFLSSSLSHRKEVTFKQ